jgi:hypothetical protein
MISYGSVPIQIAGDVEAAFIARNIPIADAFAFFRPRNFGGIFNPRIHFNWFLANPIRLNVLTQPWGASRFGTCFVLADANMLGAIRSQNGAGQALLLRIDDSLGGFISTPMLMLPPVPLAKILNVAPQLPLWLVPLADERLRFWECAAAIEVVEGTTSWTELYAAIASALGISISVDAIPAAYLKPSAGLAAAYAPLPLLLDLVASSVGQRVVRRLNGTYAAINPATATALMLAQANGARKYAGGALALGVLDA